MWKTRDSSQYFGSCADYCIYETALKNLFIEIFTERGVCEKKHSPRYLHTLIIINRAINYSFLSLSQTGTKVQIKESELYVSKKLYYLVLSVFDNLLVLCIVHVHFVPAAICLFHEPPVAGRHIFPDRLWLTLGSEARQIVLILFCLRLINICFDTYFLVASRWYLRLPPLSKRVAFKWSRPICFFCKVRIAIIRPAGLIPDLPRPRSQVMKNEKTKKNKVKSNY